MAWEIAEAACCRQDRRKEGEKERGWARAPPRPARRGCWAGWPRTVDEERGDGAAAALAAGREPRQATLYRGTRARDRESGSPRGEERCSAREESTQGGKGEAIAQSAQWIASDRWGKAELLPHRLGACTRPGKLGSAASRCMVHYPCSAAGMLGLLAALRAGPAPEWKLSSDPCLHGARFMGTVGGMGPAGTWENTAPSALNQRRTGEAAMD